jgi:hypothetical protein
MKGIHDYMLFVLSACKNIAYPRELKVYYCNMYLILIQNYHSHHSVQTSFGAHPASYPMNTRGSFSGGKAAGA